MSIRLGARSIVSATALGLLVVGLAAPAGAGSAGSNVHDAKAQHATIDVAALPVCADLPDLPTARCGSIEVPLDHENLEAGTTTVAFAVLQRTDTRRRSLGTIVPNPGGPGSSTIDLTGSDFAQALEPLLDRRDLLLIDPRGVGRSEVLTCPSLTGSAKAFASIAEQRALIGACGQELGDRARYYGTNAVADDIDDVREALGLHKLDLFGVSYGTYLMPVYAQRYPRHVRTITLAGAYALNTPTVGTADVAAFRRAVGLVCDRTTQCSAETVLADLAAFATRLREEPSSVDVEYAGSVHTVALDEWQLTTTAAAIYTNVPDTDAQLALASSAAAARNGDLEPFRALVRSRLVESATALDFGPQLHSEALLWATTCHDYPRDFDYSDDLADRAQDYEAHVSDFDASDFAPFTPAIWVSRSDYDNGACLNWPDDPTARTPFPAGRKLPNVPVLVLSGDLDANTSSTSGRESAAQFRRATFIEVPGAGHTPASDPDGVALIVRFIARGRI